MLKLYGFSKVNAVARGHTRDLRVLWALEEMQLPFELAGMDHPAGDLSTEAYRRLSPFEQIPAIDDDGLVRVSITADRAKFHNIERVPWAALHVSRKDFYAYVVLEGEASVSPVAEHPSDPTVDELVQVYRSIAGEHPDWDEYRAAMVHDRRAVARLRPSRAYGMLSMPGA